MTNHHEKSLKDLTIGDLQRICRHTLEKEKSVGDCLCEECVLRDFCHYLDSKSELDKYFLLDDFEGRGIDITLDTKIDDFGYLIAFNEKVKKFLEQLKALRTLGFDWITMDNNGTNPEKDCAVIAWKCNPEFNNKCNIYMPALEEEHGREYLIFIHKSAVHKWVCPGEKWNVESIIERLER